jgi:predicted extracellular nuclease
MPTSTISLKPALLLNSRPQEDFPRKKYLSLAATLILVALTANSEAQVIASDMVNSSSQNLISYSNPFNGAFTSAGDGFQKYQRFVSPSTPFSVLDDSLSIFTPDSLGIIKEGNTDVFFGVTDTENPDNTGPVSATWVFDISGATDLVLSIDMGAMGDFESTDTFEWTYSIDGGPSMTAFSASADEASSYTYTMEGGALVTLNDPMLVNGELLTNELTTQLAAIAGSGSQLTVTLTAQTDGGSEAFAFQNLKVLEGGLPVDSLAFDMVESGAQRLTGFTNVFNGAFSSAGDGFQKYQRFVSPSIPFAVLDDSLSIFPSDSLGIIKEGNTDIFFGVVDTENPNNSGPVSATWVFDITGGSDLGLSVDMGAMGDFESTDFFEWTYSIDGGPASVAFSSTVDEAGSNAYTLEGGSTFTLNDPMLVQGTVLTNNLATFQTPLFGTGNSLTLTLTARFDSGSEAVAFQNVIIGEGFASPPPVPLVRIHEVQGDGSASPLAGTVVAIEGVVVGDFQDTVGTNGDLNGFFVQEEDADADANPLTSEGIFVFDGSSTPAVDVAIGDVVRVEGTVSEFFGMTQISSTAGVVIQSSGNPLPTAANLSLPVASVDDFEASEGMRVTFPQPLLILEYFNFDRFGEIVLGSERRLTPTAEFEPGPDAVLAASEYLLDRITLDDGRTSQNPDPAIHPNGAEFDLANLFRGGDRVQGVTGVLNFSFGLYRVQPTVGANYSADNLRPMAPDATGGTVTVATLNVLNYFTTIDDGFNDICGPLMILECRGADDAEELARQRAKIIAALAGIDADVVGLIEIENDNADAALSDLVAGLNDAVGAGTYDYVATGGIGTDAIRVALIYKPGSVSPVGDFAVLDSSVDARFIDDKNRPVLAQSFMDNAAGGVVTVAVNHLKSKGSPCDDVSDPDTGDGSGNCNLTRAAAAEALVDWLATDPTDSGSDNFLIVGDLNSYDKEDPIDALVTGGYVDLVHSFLGEDAYSFVFDGQVGYLDYALANAALNDRVTGVSIWHINADEPDLINYDTSFKQDAQDAIYAPDAYRSSDHDPVIVGLDLCEATPPQFDTLTVTPDVLWPANHKYVDVAATVVVSDNFDPSPTVTLVSVTSNEPDNGEDDGNTVDDIVIVGDYEFELRAERSGVGTGRTYTITYEATDSCGNSTTGSAVVSVPLSRGK